MLDKKQKQLWRRRLKRMKKRVHLLFVPHKHNHYRPHLVRRYGIMGVLALVVGMQFGYNYTHTGSILGQVTEITQTGLLVNTNDARASNNLPPLEINNELSAAAEAKAAHMIEQNYWDHTAPDGTEPWAWIDQTEYQYLEAGENLAKNFTSAEATTTAWMNSESHRENILKDSYQDVGFAIHRGELDNEPTTLVVALYGTPSEEAVQGVHVATPPSSAGLAPLGFASLSPAGRVGVALQSLTPAAVTSIALLFIAATVAITAHIYRKKLPKRLQESWYKHHGVLKASGFLTVAAFIVLLYGGGQI